MGEQPDAPRQRTFTAFGAAIAIDMPDPAFERALAAVLPEHWRTTADAAPAVRYRVHRTADGACELDEGRARPVTAAPEVIARRLANWMDYRLGEHATTHAFVHAGVVLWHGRAILLPGPSRAGKTTLTAALVQAGAGYVSDDVALIGDDGRAHFLSRALTLRDDMREAFPTPAASPRSGSAPITAILFVEHRAGATLALTPLDRGQAALRLMANCMNAQRAPETALARCAAGVRDALCLAGERGEAAAAAEQLRDIARTWPGGSLQKRN